MPGSVGNRTEYINQLRELLPASEFAQLNIGEMTDDQLQAKLNEALNGNRNSGVGDVVEITTETTLTQDGNVRTEGGLLVKEYSQGSDTVIEKYEGELTQEKLKEKIVKHTDENQHVITTVINYTNGKISKKTVTDETDNLETIIEYDASGLPKEKEIYKNGEITESIKYHTIDEDGQNYVGIETTTSDGKTITTVAKKVDEDGNFTDDDFVRRIIRDSSGTNIISRNEEGNLKLTVHRGQPDQQVITYNGANLSDYENGNLQVVSTVKNNNIPLEDRVYSTAEEFKNSLPARFDKSLLTEQNHKEIFDLFENGTKDGILDEKEIEGLYEFIRTIADTNNDGSITELGLMSVSKYLQAQGIEDADMKGFIENLKSNGIHGEVVSSERRGNNEYTTYNDGSRLTRTTHTEGSYSELVRYIDGNMSLTSFYSDSHVKEKRFTVPRGTAVSMDGFKIFNPHQMLMGSLNTVSVTNSDEQTQTGSQDLVFRVARSYRYCSELNTKAAMLYCQTQQQVLDMTDGSDVSMWDGLSSVAIQGYSAVTGTESIADMHNSAANNLHTGQALYSDMVSGISQNAQFVAPGVIVYDTDANYETMVEQFENSFESHFGKNFPYDKIPKLMEKHNKYLTATTLLNQIQQIQDVIDSKVTDHSQVLTSSRISISDEDIAELRRYGFDIENVEHYEHHAPGTRTKAIYYDGQRANGHGDNYRALQMLTVCRMLGPDNPLIETLIAPENANSDNWDRILTMVQDELKNEMLQYMSEDCKGTYTSYDESDVSAYISLLQEKYNTEYNEVFGENPPDMEHLQKLMISKGVISSTMQMAATIALTNCMGGAVNQCLAEGIQAASTGDKVTGAANAFKYLTKKYGQNFTSNVARHFTNVTGALAMPAIQLVTTADDEARSEVLGGSGDMLMYGLIGSYLSGPFGDGVKELLQGKGGNIVRAMVSRASGLSAEISADAIFESVIENTDLMSSLKENGSSELQARFINMLIGARNNRAARRALKNTKYNVEMVRQNDQTCYRISQNGKEVCTTDNPDMALAGILAAGMTNAMKQEVQGHTSEAIDEYNTANTVLSQKNLMKLVSKDPTVQVDNEGNVTRFDETSQRRIIIGKVEKLTSEQIAEMRENDGSIMPHDDGSVTYYDTKLRAYRTIGWTDKPVMLEGHLKETPSEPDVVPPVNNPTFDEFKTSANANNESYTVITDADGNKLVVKETMVGDETKLNITVYDKDGNFVETKDNLSETDLKSQYESFYKDEAQTEMFKDGEAIVNDNDADVEVLSLEERISAIKEKLSANGNNSAEDIDNIVANINEENIALVEKLSADKKFKPWLIKQILDSMSKQDESLRKKTCALAEKLCANERYEAYEIRNILYSINEKNLAVIEKLLANENLPKEFITDTIYRINDDNVSLAEKLFADKKYNPNIVAQILFYTASEDRTLVKDLCALVEDLYADEYINGDLIKNIISSTNKENLALVKKTCANKDFPAGLIPLILTKVNSDNIAFAERLCSDKDFPKDLIYNILNATNKDNMALAEELCADKELNKKVIPLMLEFGITDKDIFTKQSLSELVKNEKREFIKFLLANKSAICAGKLIIDGAPLIPKNDKEYAEIMTKVAQSLNISLEPVSTDNVAHFDASIRNLQTALKNIDLSDLSEISLSTTHQDFINQVNEIIKDLPESEQNKIKDYFGFDIENGRLLGYPSNKNKDPNLSEITDPNTLEILNRLRPIVENYRDNNSITAKDKPELNDVLKSLSEIMPEIFNQIDGSSTPVETIKTLQKIMQNPKFETLSENDKKILTVAALLHNTDKYSGDASESAFDAYFIAKKFNLSDADAQKVYAIISNSDAVEKFMSANEVETRILKLNKFYIVGQQRQDIFDLLAFNLKEGNAFEMTQMLYSAKQPDGFTRHFDNALNSRINEIRTADFVLPQTSPETYKEHSTTLTIERDGVKYSVLVVNSEDIPDFYAYIHTPEAGFATGGGRNSNFSNFDAFAVIADDKVICTSYVTNGAAVLAQEYSHGFIFDVKNGNQFVGSNHDLFSLGKNIPEIIIEYYRDRGIFTPSGKEKKFEHRTHISDSLKAALFGTDYASKRAIIYDKLARIDSEYNSQIEELNNQLHSLYEAEYSKHPEYRELRYKILQLQSQKESLPKKEYETKLKELSDKVFEMTRPWYQTIRNLPVITTIETRIESLNRQKQNEINNIEGLSEINEIDRQYAERLNNIKAQLGNETMTFENVERIDSEFARAYRELMAGDNLLNSEHHNEVVVSNPTITGIFTSDISELPVEYLKKAQEEGLPIVVIKN